MRSLKSLVLVLSIALLFIGCGSSNSSNSDDAQSINIESVYTDIIHDHTSYYEKWGLTPIRSIRFTVSVRISDSKGIDNLKAIYLHNKENDRYFSLLGGPYNVTKEQCFYAALAIFECQFYSSVSLDQINLGNWEVVVENKQDNILSKDFEFLLPGGDRIEDEQFIYSSSYVGSTEHGIPALETLTITGNELVFTSNPGLQTFHIEFQHTDTRATQYSFAFYDATPQINYIGYANLNSPSIVSTPLTQDQKTSIDIPYSEIVLNSNTTIDDINGLHIKLYDAPIPWLENGSLWFNYISFSEFLTLSP